MIWSDHCYHPDPNFELLWLFGLDPKNLINDSQITLVLVIHNLAIGHLELPAA